MQVPNGDVSVAAAREADFGVGADGQGVARRRRRSELGLDARCLRGQIPDGQRAGLASDDQCATVRQQLTGADVVIPVLSHRGQRESIHVQGGGDSDRERERDIESQREREV